MPSTRRRRRPRACRPALLHYGLLALISLTIVATLSSVGLILAIGLLIAPGAIAFLLTRQFRSMMGLAVAVTIAGDAGRRLPVVLSGQRAGTAPSSCCCPRCSCWPSAGNSCAAPDLQPVRPRAIRRNCTSREAPAAGRARCQVSLGSRDRRRNCVTFVPVGVLRWSARCLLMGSSIR